jgi:hypothetical protein
LFAIEGAFTRLIASLMVGIYAEKGEKKRILR